VFLTGVSQGFRVQGPGGGDSDWALQRVDSKHFGIEGGRVHSVLSSVRESAAT
jgi:hypothetical protein